MPEHIKKFNYPSTFNRDDKGNVINPNYTNGLSTALTPASGNIIFPEDKYPIGVYVIPLTSGTLKVMLLDQIGSESYTYAEAEVTAYLGRPFEGRVKKIFTSGTTVTSVKVVW